MIRKFSIDDTLHADDINAINNVIAPLYAKGLSVERINIGNSRKVVYEDKSPSSNVIEISTHEAGQVNQNDLKAIGFFVSNSLGKNIANLMKIIVDGVEVNVNLNNRNVHLNYTPMVNDLLFITIMNKIGYINITRGKDGTIGSVGAKGERGPNGLDTSGTGNLIINSAFHVDQMGTISSKYEPFKSIDSLYQEKVMTLSPDGVGYGAAYIFDTFSVDLPIHFGANILFYKPDPYGDGIGIRSVYADPAAEGKRPGSLAMFGVRVRALDISSIYPEQFLTLQFTFKGNVTGKYVIKMRTNSFDTNYIEKIVPDETNETRDGVNYTYVQPNIETLATTTYSFDHVAGQETKVSFLIDLKTCPETWRSTENYLKINFLNMDTNETVAWWEGVNNFVEVSDLALYPGRVTREKEKQFYDVELFKCLESIEIPDVSYITIAKSTDQNLKLVHLDRSLRYPYQYINNSVFLHQRYNESTGGVHGYNMLTKKIEEITPALPSGGGLTPDADYVNDIRYGFVGSSELHIKCTDVVDLTKFEWKFEGMGHAYCNSANGWLLYRSINLLMFPKKWYSEQIRALP